MNKNSVKEPTELTIEERLKNLYSLQTMLSQIDNIKLERGELPLEVQDLEDEIEGNRTRQVNMQDKISELQSDIKNREEAIRRAESDLARYKQQLDNVHNSKEFDGLTKEIEYMELDIELHEKKIGQAKNEIESLNKSIEESKANLAELEIDLQSKKEELDEVLRETHEEEEKLRQRVKQTELTIDTRLLTSFKRIRKNARNGLGIVCVNRDACGGCFNKIPPQRQLDVRSHKKVIVCEYCGRILVDPELAGIKTATETTEAPKKKTTRARAKKA